MIISVLQGICIVLFVFGVLFSLLELRTRLDRSFLYFGIVIMLLAAFSAIDLWRPHQVWWISLQHILYFFIVPCIVWYLMILTKSKNILIIKGLLFIGLVFSFLVFGGFMFVQEDGFVGTKALYQVTVAPYMTLLIYSNINITPIIVFAGSKIVNLRNKAAIYPNKCAARSIGSRFLQKYIPSAWHYAILLPFLADFGRNSPDT